MHYLYIGIYGTVAGDTEWFNTMSRIRLGCPISTLLFRLFFDNIIAHIQSTLHALDMVAVTNVAVWVPRYADNVVLMSPNVPGLTC